MFGYYGAKQLLAKEYPKPLFNKIIEPFAGSARYSLEHWENDVLLVDKYQTIIDIWLYLQQCSRNDILSLPRLKRGESLDDYSFDCQQQKDLMGFVIGFGSTRPRKKATMWVEHRPNGINFALNRIADNLHKIKHWEIRCDDYMHLENEKATWFIDPPYQVGGQHYAHGNKAIDFKGLSRWCKSRQGHVIVCENTNADWMEFEPLKTQKGIKGVTTECIWTNIKPLQQQIKLEL